MFGATASEIFNNFPLEMEDASMRAMQIIEWGKPLEARDYPDPEPRAKKCCYALRRLGSTMTSWTPG